MKEEKKKLPISRHFFKVLMPGSFTKLSVPPAFCKRLSGKKSDEAILTTREGKWRVKVEKSKRGLIYFELGWNEFARDHGLNLGDFLVFEHKGDMKFDVSLFDKSSCEKEYPREKWGDEREREGSGDPVKVHGDVKHAKKEEGPLEEPGSSIQEPVPHSPGNPCFTTTICKSHGIDNSPCVNIPRRFLMSNDLSGYGSITLRDPNGRLWRVKLASGYSGNYKRTTMTSGWKTFYISNNLKKGDVCIFELIERTDTAIMDVHIYPLPT